MNWLASTLLSLAMLAALLLLIGAARLGRVPGERRRAALMLVAALVLAGNVLVWTL